MNVLVCIKQVPDNSVVPKLDPNTNRVVTEGVELMERPVDLTAVEAGLQLVEENPGGAAARRFGRGQGEKLCVSKVAQVAVVKGGNRNLRWLWQV